MAKRLSDIKFNRVVDECFVVIRPNALLVGVILVGFTAAYSLLDIVSTNGSLANLFSIASLFVQYFFTEAVLKDRLPRDGRPARRFGSLFLASFFGGLGIVVAGIFLLVPGIYLMARWSISGPLVVVEQMNGRQALAASWKATEQVHWPLFSAFAAGLAMLAVLYVVLGVTTEGLELAESNPTIIVLTNALMAAFMVGGWILSVAIYRLLNPSMRGLEQVFA